MSLTAGQLDELKRALDARHAALEAEIREDAQRAREDTVPDLAGPAPDAGDASVADLIAGLDSSEFERDITEFREIEAALDRIAKGGYGICTDCGSDIAFERLRAQPAARRCISCQSAHERAFAGPGTPSL